MSTLQLKVESQHLYQYRYKNTMDINLYDFRYKSISFPFQKIKKDLVCVISSQEITWPLVS